VILLPNLLNIYREWFILPDRARSISAFFSAMTMALISCAVLSSQSNKSIRPAGSVGRVDSWGGEGMVLSGIVSLLGDSLCSKH